MDQSPKTCHDIKPNNILETPLVLVVDYGIEEEIDWEAIEHKQINDEPKT